ncbi:hypothetical protein LY78DRAFT_687453 [Colletotrichum sublineola]|nr:hypothetical protein LY78DRAFT_687453 [Colletotrichum sublineola]
MIVASPVAQPTTEQPQQHEDREMPAEAIDFIKRGFNEVSQGRTCSFLGDEKGCQEASSTFSKFSGPRESRN